VISVAGQMASHAPARQQPQHDHDERDDEQDVNQAAGDMHRETEKPQNQQENDNRPQHR
jgi:hypothetical protein